MTRLKRCLPVPAFLNGAPLDVWNALKARLLAGVDRSGLQRWPKLQSHVILEAGMQLRSTSLLASSSHGGRQKKVRGARQREALHFHIPHSTTLIATSPWIDNSADTP